MSPSPKLLCSRAAYGIMEPLSETLLQGNKLANGLCVNTSVLKQHTVSCLDGLNYPIDCSLLCSQNSLENSIELSGLSCLNTTF